MGGGCAWSWRGGGAGPGGYLVKGVACSEVGGVSWRLPTPPMTTAAGGPHPTGMHSCFYWTFTRCGRDPGGWELYIDFHSNTCPMCCLLLM